MNDDATQVMTRPWSPVEVAAEMQATIAAHEEAVMLLVTLGGKAASTSNAYRRAESHWLLRVKDERPDLKSDAMRKAWIWENTDLPDLELQRTIAAHHYADQAKVCKQLERKGNLLQSMKKGAEDMMDSWPGARSVPNEPDF